MLNVIIMKNSKNKTRWNIVPFEIIEQIAEILTYGAERYGDNTWKNVDKKLWYDAMMRHVAEYSKGKKYNDKDWNHHHLMHAICNAMFIVYIEQNNKNKK